MAVEVFACGERSFFSGEGLTWLCAVGEQRGRGKGGGAGFGGGGQRVKGNGRRGGAPWIRGRVRFRGGGKRGEGSEALLASSLTP